MARSNIPLRVDPPDFARIREESGRHTEQAVRELYATSLDTRQRLQRMQQTFAWQPVPLQPGISRPTPAPGQLRVPTSSCFNTASWDGSWW